MEHPDRNICAERERTESPPLDPNGAVLCEPVARQRGDITVVSDLPEPFPVSDEEIGLLRAFLSDEIGAILRGDS
ncbi:hypothetical protein [Shinella zoogloeoides]